MPGDPHDAAVHGAQVMPGAERRAVPALVGAARQSAYHVSALEVAPRRAPVDRTPPSVTLEVLIARLRRPHLPPQLAQRQRLAQRGAMHHGLGLQERDPAFAQWPLRGRPGDPHEPPRGPGREVELLLDRRAHDSRSARGPSERGEPRVRPPGPVLAGAPLVAPTRAMGPTHRSHPPWSQQSSDRRASFVTRWLSGSC